MLEAVVAAIVAMSGIVPFVTQSSQLAKNLPPRPDPATITCHDKSWEDATLVPIKTAKLHRRFAPFVELAIKDAANSGYSLVINSAYRTCPEQKQLRITACGVGDYNLYQKP